jgi:metal-responsive CopG/Arc/MetJ family transcriptional regulator
MYNKQKHRTINSFATGISMPLNLLAEIDTIRKDVPRSRFIVRMIQENLPQSGSKVGAAGQTAAGRLVVRTSNALTKEPYNHRD